MEGIRSPIRKSPKREEDRLILLQNRNDPISQSFSSDPDLLVKVESIAKPVAGENKISRDSSYDFRNDAALPTGISPKYTDDHDNNSVDFDFPKHKGKSEDLDLESQSQNLSPVSESPNEYGKITPRSFAKVSSRESELVQRRSMARSAGASRQREDEVVACNSNSSFRRRSALLKTRTNSRLLDPPETGERRSGWLKKSGMIHQNKNDESFLKEDLDDDLPQDYKKRKFICLSAVDLLFLILMVAAIIWSTGFPYLRSKTDLGMHLCKWEVMVLVSIFGAFVSNWLIWIVELIIQRNFLLRKRLLYFVYGLRMSLLISLWLGLVLLSWMLILYQNVERETHNKFLSGFTKGLQCFWVGTVLWLFKTLLVKVVAMSFHRTVFFDRIQDALFNQYVIETLSGPPLIKIQEEEGRVVSEGKNPTLIGGEEGGISIDHLHRLNLKNVSAWNMKRLIHTVRKGVLSTFAQSNMEDKTSMQITSKKQAKSAAKRIFNNVVRPYSNLVYEDDLMAFMRDDEARKVMRLFEGSTETETKGISKQAIKNWVVNVFKERRALALSLSDTKTAVRTLDRLSNVLVAFAAMIIGAMICGVPIGHLLVFLSSQFLLLTFMFGNTFNTAFKGMVFLFVMHPFDVGDRCEIEGVQMIVDKMNLLTTVFIRDDNRKIMYPNSVLATKPISNYYRSPDIRDEIDLCA